MLAVLAFLCVFVWLVTNRMPRTPRGKVGIVLAIAPEDQDEARRLEADFTSTLRTLLTAPHHPGNFALVVVPRHLAFKIVDDRAGLNCLRRTRGSFLIYGLARRRLIDNKETHYLTCNGLVCHAPAPTPVLTDLAEDFGSILPRRLVIPRESDVFGFEASSALIDIAARYVIAQAAFISGFVKYAEELFLDVERRVLLSGRGALAVGSIPQKVPKRLAALYEVWSRHLAEEHFRTRNPEIVVLSECIADKLLDRVPGHYGALLQKAICHFLLRRDVAAAKLVLRRCRRMRDGAWRYSRAFLLAYEGNMAAAIREYGRAFRAPLSSITVPIQCEEFIQLVFEEEPEKIQLLLCMGLINMRAKRDPHTARRDFEDFLRRASCVDRVEERKLADEYCQEAERLLRQRDNSESSN